MPTPPVPAELVALLEQKDERMRRLLLRARDFVWRYGQPAAETIFDAGYAISIGYGASAKMKDWGVYTAMYTRHVNIGFINGVSLKDPRKILRGAGKQMRHVQIHDTTDLDSKPLAALVKAAISEKKRKPALK